MSELNASNLRKEQGNEGPDLVGTTELTSPYFMVPPSGTTAERPENPEPGTLRFNTDSGSLEYFKGDTLGWEQIVRTSPNLGGGSGSNAGLGGRGIIPGGNASPDGTCEVIQYMTISTLGDSADFGDLNAGVNANTGGGNRTRAFSAGGSTIPALVNTMEYVTTASLGNGTDFGDQSVKRASLATVCNQTRAVMGGGSGPSGNSNIIDYKEISTTSDTVDFGDLATAVEDDGSGGASSTRGLFQGGNPGINVISYITMATTGNATDFGDTIDTTIRKQGCSNATRGVIPSGDSPSTKKGIEFVTISTLGNSILFGELTVARRGTGSVASPIRAVFMGGEVSPAKYNVMDYVQIATTGNAVDFGDLTTAGSENGILHASGNSSSNCHGGL